MLNKLIVGGPVVLSFPSNPEIKPNLVYVFVLKYGISMSLINSRTKVYIRRKEGSHLLCPTTYLKSGQRA